MRRMLATLSLLAASLVLLACGKSAHLPSKPTARAGAASTAASHSGRAATKAQARALARALNLRPGDLPSFRRNSEREHESHSEKVLARRARACMGGKGQGASLAEIGSDTFDRKYQIFNVSVSSSVEVANTPAQALAQLSLIRGSHTRGCLAAFLSGLMAQQTKGGASAKIVSITKGTPPAPGTSGSFGWRITGGMSIHGVRIPFYVDMLGFAYGQAMVSLFSFGLPVPFPPKAERQLFGLLVQRAKTGGGGTLGRPGKTPQTSGPRQVQISL